MKSATFIIFILAFTSLASAFENTIRFGPALIFSNDNRQYNTEETTFKIFGTGYMRWNDFWVNDRGLVYSPYNTKTLELFINGNIHGENYESLEVASISNRRPTIFAGGGLRFYPLTIFTLFDLENKSQGQLTRIQLQALHIKGPWIIFPTLAYTIYDENYSQYYFGVKPQESSLVVPSYQLNGGHDMFFNFRLFYQIFERWQIYLMAEYLNLSQDIENSPTVSNQSVKTGQLGFIYKFY